MAERGRRVYVANGCFYCHSQQIRADYAAADIDLQREPLQARVQSGVIGVARRAITFSIGRRCSEKCELGPDLANIGKAAPAEEEAAPAQPAPAGSPGGSPAPANASPAPGNASAPANASPPRAKPPRSKTSACRATTRRHNLQLVLAPVRAANASPSPANASPPQQMRRTWRKPPATVACGGCVAIATCRSPFARCVIFRIARRPTPPPGIINISMPRAV